jgi:DNA polymerase elongation subunit (family B)
MQNYIYDWSYDVEDEHTVIRIFCLNKHNNTVCLNVRDFTPYFYIELPETVSNSDLDDKGNLIMMEENIKWTKDNVKLLDNELKKTYFKYNKPVQCSLKNRKKLYYVHKNDKMKDKYTKFLLYRFNTNKDFRTFKYKLNTTVNIPGIGGVSMKLHEFNVSPVLQLVCEQNIPMAGWVEIEGGEGVVEKETSCEFEFEVSCKDLHEPTEDCGNTPDPVVLSFDIEVYSSNPDKFPDGNKFSDCIFQISCVFWRINDKKLDNYLLTIGDADEKIVGEDEDVKTLCYDSEAKLLIGFIKLIHKHNPHLITGWNILGFDINYIITRSQLLLLEDELSSLGMVKGKCCTQIDTSWSSAAYGKQSFSYYDWDGRIIIDLLTFARREIKSENYKLETIASLYVKAHKDPLTHKDIFRGYEYGVLRLDEFGEEGIKLLSVVGKYCVKDSILVQRLFNVFDMWIGLTEMSAVCNVPSSYLYTKGQQVKVYSQVYKYCYDNKIVVENNGYECKDNERYQGAYVKEPEPGIYHYVVPFDFKSLYPTLIVAYNIDYSTFVIDEKIPDDLCHVIEWDEEHEYDIHDCIHCGKRTRGERTALRNKLVSKSFTTSITCENCDMKFETGYDNIKCYEGTEIKKDKISPPTDTFKDVYKYRFLKEPKGVLPTIITNLLDARSDVRKYMKTLKTKMKELSGDDLTNTKNLVSILNKRQLSYKVSANSMYGALGVRKGMLPLMPGAMCVTAMGRFSLHKAAEHLIDKYGVKWIYSDTDSTYVQFPGVPPEKLWEHSKQIEKEMLRDKVFPDPMVLEFEEAIYDPFFILTKKRYMWRYYHEDGSRSTDVGNKGVVLARRGTSKFLKDIYQNLVNGIFEGWDKEQTLYYILNTMNNCCSSSLPIEDFIITKKVGDIESYTKGRSLPAHVRLAETMRERGTRVDVGQRLEYVVTTRGGLKARITEKVESVEYQQKYSDIITIDYLYYIHLIMKQVEEILHVVFKTDDFMGKQYKLRVNKYKMMEELRHYFSPKLVFNEPKTIEFD